MDTRKLEGRTAVVTGAGSGIGRACAQLMAARGASLHLCDLNAASLEATAEAIRASGARVSTRQVDVSSADQMQAFAESVHREVEAIDILINNAGVAMAGLVEELGIDDWRWLMDINFWGVIYGQHFFLPAMIARRSGGHIANISSMAAFAPFPGSTPYAVSKWAVRALSECTRAEVARHGIGVTAICPGVIATGIAAAARYRGRGDTPHFRDQLMRGMHGRGYAPEKVARKILLAIQRNRAVAPISPEAWLGYVLGRLAPGPVRWCMQKGLERSYPCLSTTAPGAP